MHAQWAAELNKRSSQLEAPDHLNMFPPKDSNGCSMQRLLSSKPKYVFFLLLLKYFDCLAPSDVLGYPHAILGNKLTFYFQMLCPYAFPFYSSVEQGFALTQLSYWRFSAPQNGCFYTPSCGPFPGWNKAPEQHKATACPGPYRLLPRGPGFYLGTCDTEFKFLCQLICA